MPTTRTDPTEMINYEVIIHLDRVFDYSPCQVAPHIGVLTVVLMDCQMISMRKSGQSNTDFYAIMVFLMTVQFVVVFRFKNGS